MPESKNNPTNSVEPTVADKPVPPTTKTDSPSLSTPDEVARNAETAARVSRNYPLGRTPSALR